MTEEDNPRWPAGCGQAWGEGLRTNDLRLLCAALGVDIGEFCKHVLVCRRREASWAISARYALHMCHCPIIIGNEHIAALATVLMHQVVR